MSTFIPKVKPGQILNMRAYNKHRHETDKTFKPFSSFMYVDKIRTGFNERTLVYAVTKCTGTGKKFKDTNGFDCMTIDKLIDEGLIIIQEATATEEKTVGRLLAKDAEIGKPYLIKHYFNSKRIIYVPVIITGFGERRVIATDMLGMPTAGPFLHEEIHTNVKSWLDTEVKKTQAEIDAKTSYLVSLNSFYDNIQ